MAASVRSSSSIVGAPSAGQLSPSRPSQPHSRALHARHAGELLVEQQRLHATLVQRRAAPPRCRRAALPEPLERLGLASALELVEARLGGREHLLGRRVVDVDLDAAGQPVAQVAVQLRLEVRRHLARAADDQALEGPALEVAHERLARVLQVVVLLLLDATREARLGPAALVVLAEHGVVDLLDLTQAVGRAAEDAGVAPADERDAPALAALEPRERPDERRVADRDAVADRAGQLDRLEQVGGLAREQGDAMRALGGELALEERRPPARRGLERGAVRRATGRCARARAVPPRRAGSAPRSRARAACANSEGSRSRYRLRTTRPVEPQLGQRPQLVAVGSGDLHALPSFAERSSSGSTRRVRGHTARGAACRGSAIRPLRRSSDAQSCAQ